MEEITQLRLEGYCLLKGVIPADKVGQVRQDIDNEMKAGLEAYDKHDWSAVTHMLSLAPYFADRRLLKVARTAFNHAKVRISQTEFKSVPPFRNPPEWRNFHTDWPHDLTDRSYCGLVNQPFPDAIMSITSIWMLYPFTPENGATWVVPRTHRDPRNPRGQGDGIDGMCSIPHEQQICGDAGDVILIDSRIWHSAGANSTDEIRTSVVARYSPWWLSVDYGKRNCAFVPAHIFDAFPAGVQELYEHRRVKNEPLLIGEPFQQHYM